MSPKAQVIIVAVVALALRVGCAFWWQEQLPSSDAFRFGDSQTYWVLGQQISRGNEYYFGDRNSSVFRAPGYPSMLATLFLTIGAETDVINARILGAFLGTLTVLGVMILTAQLVGSRYAFASGLLAALYPGLIVTSVLILSEAPFMLGMVVHLILWVDLTRKAPLHSSATAILCGVAGGWAILVRPSWLVFVPFLGAVSLALGPDRRQTTRQLMLICFGIAIAMGPWWARNYQLTGRFVPTTLQVGASLYDGLSPTATGASNMDFVLTFHRRQKQADSEADILHSTFEYRLDQRLKQASVDWASQHPGQVARLSLVKLARVWNPLPNNAELNSWSGRIAIASSFLVIVGLAVVGLVSHRSNRQLLLFCLSPVVYFTLLHMVFVSSIRYRQPCMLVLTVFAGIGMVHARNWLFKRESGS